MSVTSVVEEKTHANATMVMNPMTTKIEVLPMYFPLINKWIVQLDNGALETISNKQFTRWFAPRLKFKTRYK